MRYFKGCPKCGGTVYPERQLGNTVDYCCLQCGRRLNESEAQMLLKRPSPSRRWPPHGRSSAVSAAWTSSTV